MEKSARETINTTNSDEGSMMKTPSLAPVPTKCEGEISAFELNPIAEKQLLRKMDIHIVPVSSCG